MPGAQSGMEMPDMKQMSGIPRPVDDLPAGTVSVRLIRGSLSNNIADHDVELTENGKTVTVRTDASGHAEFKALTPGTPVKASATVDGERLESQEFQVPPRGGVRLMLVATDKEGERKKAEEASAPAVPGQVVLAGESRIVIEPGDEAVTVYYLLDIMNTARAPVNPPSTFIFDVPRAAVGTTLIEGSSPQALVTGTRVRVNGPFKPGKTSIQVAYELPVTGGTMQFTQRFPATMEQLAVISQKAGAMRLVSPQLSNQREMPDNGKLYIVAAGGTVPAGAPVNLTLDDLPHRSTAPRTLALVLAVLIVLIGVFAAFRPVDPAARQTERQRLVERREKLFAELVRVEQDLRRGRGDQSRLVGRRSEIFSALEHIYGALDEDGEAAFASVAANGGAGGPGTPRSASNDAALRAS